MYMVFMSLWVLRVQLTYAFALMRVFGTSLDFSPFFNLLFFLAFLIFYFIHIRFPFFLPFLSTLFSEDVSVIQSWSVDEF